MSPFILDVIGRESPRTMSPFIRDMIGQNYFLFKLCLHEYVTCSVNKLCLPSGGYSFTSGFTLCTGLSLCLRWKTEWMN